MRYIPFLCCAAFCAALLTGCKKEANILQTSPDPLISQARRYFAAKVLPMVPVPAANGMSTKDRRVLWDKAVVNKHRQSVIVPIAYVVPDFVYDPGAGHYYSANSITRLVMIKDSTDNFNTIVQLRLPDSTFLQHPSGKFSGLVLQENWLGQQLKPYRVAAIEKPSQQTGSHGLSAVDAENATITVCTTIYGYNYPAGDPSDGYSWSSTSCNTITLPDDDDDGGGGGGTAEGGGGSGTPDGSSTGGSTRPLPSGKTVVVTSPSSAIVNVPDYLQCFTNSPGASYQVKICVDQPNAGARDPWGLTYPADAVGGANPFDVGHSFLVLTESDGYNTIVRNIGFYPGATIFPWTGNVPGIFNNDQMHPYNISAAFNITAANFANLLSYIQNSTGQSYNLSTNNCTTWVLNALSAGHVYLPSTFGYWPGGIGNDPGDLGEDIRNSNAPGIVKSTSEDIHMNSGSCGPGFQ